MNVAAAFNASLLAACSARRSLHSVFTQYHQRANNVLSTHLPYEPTPPPARRCSFQFDTTPLVIVAHCLRSKSNGESKVTLATGFALAAQSPRNENVVLTCAHTLEQSHTSSLFSSAEDIESATVVVSRSSGSVFFNEPFCVLSSLPKSDLLLLSVPGPRIPTLPVSPYPATVGTSVRTHLVTERHPLVSDNGADTPAGTAWKPWLVEGAFWSSWSVGRVLGYKDSAGREAQTGTYDELAHVLFEPCPTAGSSGGPMIDEQTGAVVGVVRGTRMDSSIEGLRGWGTPAEAIFEMFSLPGITHR